jgi:signal transduction histidine kinase
MKVYQCPFGSDPIMAFFTVPRNRLNLHVERQVCRFARPNGTTGSPAQLSQVFMNLMSMLAMRSRRSRPGSPRRSVLQIRTRIGGEHLLIEFEDRGCGIPAHLLERVFESFYATKGATQGSGLGLAISMGIVERHGGGILVHSVEGEGSRFTVRLALEGAASESPGEDGSSAKDRSGH